MTAWEEYLAATQRLDAVRRDAASVVATQAAALKAARADLLGVRQRAERQRARLTAAARDAGVPAPATAPTAADRTGARQALAAPIAPATVQVALHNGGAILDAADASLSTVESAARGARLSRISTWNVELRNLFVYVGFAIAAVLVPVITLSTLPNKLLQLPTIGCAALLPALGYGLAWITVGMLYRPEHRGRVRRTPIMGAAVTIATVVLLYTLYAVLTLAHVF